MSVFASVDDLRDRWPDMPAGSDAHAGVLLEDASQFILDLVPTAGDAPESTRRRVVCAVVKRAMSASTAEHVGLSQFNVTAGPFIVGGAPSNPHGDFYLTRNERRVLGEGQQRAFGAGVVGLVRRVEHFDWCAGMWGVGVCTCGLV